MRIGGHPLHVMLVHFPVALWPAHWVFHVAAVWRPTLPAGVAGFWLLVAGTAVGWLAALSGISEWLAIVRGDNSGKLRDASWHAVINGSVLIGFTVLAAREWPRYPQIAHGASFLVAEASLLGLLLTGNYFGGAVIWRARKL